jgi:hypothetical protein
MASLFVQAVFWIRLGGASNPVDRSGQKIQLKRHHSSRPKKEAES